MLAKGAVKAANLARAGPVDVLAVDLEYLYNTAVTVIHSGLPHLNLACTGPIDVLAVDLEYLRNTAVTVIVSAADDVYSIEHTGRTSATFTVR